MMRVFQIWHQKSNPIKFESLLATKTVDGWQNKRFSQILTVFWPKGDQMLLDLNFDARFESSHHLASSRPHFSLFSHFNCYASHVINWPKMRVVVPNFFRKAIFDKFIMISVKNASDTYGWDRAYSKSRSNRTILTYSFPFPPILTYGPKTKTSKPMQPGPPLTC